MSDDSTPTDLIRDAQRPKRLTESLLAIAAMREDGGAGTTINPLDLLPESPTIEVDKVALDFAAMMFPLIESEVQSNTALIIAAACAAARRTHSRNGGTATPADLLAMLRNAAYVVADSFPGLK